MLGLVRTSREARRPLEKVPTERSERALRKRARGLAEELKRRTDAEIRFDDGSRALYASDLSMYRQVPIGVVIPRTLDDVVEVVAACRERDIPILPRGTGTSLAGQTCNVAVVIDFSRHLNRLLELDPMHRTAYVQPGLIRDQLNDAAAKHGLTFVVDTATHEYATLGGMIGNNSCGTHSVWGGRTTENVEALDVLTYDGLRLRLGPTSPSELEDILAHGGRRAEIYRKLRDLRDRYAPAIRARYPKIPRRVSGYNLDDLLPEKGFDLAHAFVGSEGTLGVVLGARVRLLPDPPRRALLVIGFPDAATAADLVPEIRQMKPTALEAVHSHVVENLARKGKETAGETYLPDAKCWLLAEFPGDTQAEADDRAQRAKTVLSRRSHVLGTAVISDPKAQQKVWKIRESGVASSRVPIREESWPSWEDTAVAPDKLGPYLREFLSLIGRYDYDVTLFGHFGEGCVHSRITFESKTRAGVRHYRQFLHEAAELVCRYGGSLSGEHGEGQARGELLDKMFGPELVEAFREFKTIWDPHWRMNPGKLVDAFPSDKDLRVGPDYAPKQVPTHFKFPDDNGSFSKATERCFGIGKCRSLEGQTMCPSFQVTRDEKYTTRGRARLLFEMLRGDSLQGGWSDPAVKESLDLCLSCKGCKHDCPVSVDMATYRAEFLSHYYEGKPLPRAAIVMGLIHRWATLARTAPRVANLFTQTALSAKAKRLAGLAPKRKLPSFAEESFQAWFARRRKPTNDERPLVLLWPDTFHNHFRPNTAKAAVKVLEHAGFRVEVPAQDLCCGRPLYDYGMLDEAKQRLVEILDALRPHIRAGVPVIALEPSCGSVFLDELHNLFPADEDARRLRDQTFLFADFLRSRQFEPPRLERKAVLHGHCHHKALVKLASERELLEQMGLKLEVPDEGCCGLAGSFGYEADKYDLSMAIGEQRLLPAVRKAEKDTLVIADGFSCRSQVEHGTDRRPLHVAEVIAMALEEGPHGPRDDPPERRYVQPEPGNAAPRLAIAAGLLGLAGASLAVRRALR